MARESAESKAAGTVVPVLADVTRAGDCEKVVDAAVTRFGRLDILVNNAGPGMKYVSDSFLTEPTRFWEISPETWRLIVDTNVNGPFFMARCAAPLMIRARWGRIINISVSRETMRRRGFSPYGPSKAALESETIIWSQSWPVPESQSMRFFLADRLAPEWFRMVSRMRSGRGCSIPRLWCRRFSG